MTNETKQTIELAKSISETIIELYNELAELEINNLKESKEYQNIISRLNVSINLEYNIISRVFTDWDQTIQAINYLNINTESNEVSLIIMKDKDKLLNRRLSELIRKHLITNINAFIKSQIVKELPEYIQELINMPEIAEELTKINQSNSPYYILANSLDTDLSYYQLILLEAKIKGKYNKKDKSELIKAKYNLIFITPQIEENLKRNQYQIPSELFFTTYLTANMYRVENNEIQNFINNIKYLIYKKEINSLLPDPKKLTYVNKSPLELSLREIKIRTALAFFTDEELINANEKFHDFVDDLRPEYFEELIETISYAFKLSQKDKTRIKKLTI